MKAPLLIADIGGTNARFALVEPGSTGFFEARTLACTDFSTPEEAITSYLELVKASAPSIICFAVAGPIVDHTVSFTNNPWKIAASTLKSTFGCEQATLLNDFEAVAWSIPAVNRAETQLIGTVQESDLSAENFSVSVIGPGTGLGAAGLIRRSGRTFPLITEAGHVGFAPEDETQTEIRRVLGHRYKRVSDERLVSGMGIRNLYWALGEIRGIRVEDLSETEIFDAAAKDSLAGDSVALMFEILGQAAGNLVLSIGAFDGVYVAGGVAQRHPDKLIASPFRRGFENKGRHQRLMEQVPSALITHDQPGLLGAAEVARQLFSQRFG